MTTQAELNRLADETDSAMNDIQQSIEQADKMLITLEEQGLQNSPTAQKIRNLVDSMREQRSKLMANMQNGNRKVTFADHLAEQAAAGDSMAMAAMPRSSSKSSSSSIATTAERLAAAAAKPALKKINHPVPMSDEDSDVDVTKAKNSGTKFTDLPDDIFSMLTSFIDSSSKEQNSNSTSKALSPRTALNLNLAESNPASSASLSGLTSALANINNSNGNGSAGPLQKLEQLDALESQLTEIKSFINDAKVKAAKELEDQKSASNIDLSNNISFLNLSHAVENLKVLQNTQYDRLKDIVSILNNHADRLISIEDNIHEIREDTKRTSLNSMSEKLLENLLKVHNGRPHFILELFEIASKIDSDEKRQMAIATLKNLEKYEPPKSNSKCMVAPKALKSLEAPVEDKKEEATRQKTVPSLSTLAEKAAERQDENEVKDKEEKKQTEEERIRDTLEHIVKTQLPRQTTSGTNQDDEDDDDDDDDSSETSTETDQQGQHSSTAEYSDIHTNEVNDNRRIDEQKTDMVSRMLGAAQLGVNVNDVQDEVKKLVTELLPTLTRNYRNKILTYDVIDEAKSEIADHILNNTSAFNSDRNKVELYQAIEKCLLSYKDKSVGEFSTEILMDIGTSILKAMLSARSQK